MNMKEFEWDQHDVYVSNDGNGPLRARILCVSEGVVKMERWHPNTPDRRDRFELSLDYLTSPKCGWKNPCPTQP